MTWKVSKSKWRQQHQCQLYCKNNLIIDFFLPFFFFNDITCQYTRLRRHWIKSIMWETRRAKIRLAVFILGRYWMSNILLRDTKISREIGPVDRPHHFSCLISYRITLKQMIALHLIRTIYGKERKKYTFLVKRVGFSILYGVLKIWEFFFTVDDCSINVLRITLFCKWTV